MKHSDSMLNLLEEKHPLKQDFINHLDRILDKYNRRLSFSRENEREMISEIRNLFDTSKSMKIIKRNIDYIIEYNPLMSSFTIRFIDERCKRIDNIDDIFTIKDTDIKLIDLLKELDEKITRESKELSDNYVKYNVTPEGYYWLEKWNNNRQKELLDEIISLIEDVNNEFDDSFLDKVKDRISRYIEYFDIIKTESSVDIISYITSIYVQLLWKIKGGIKNENK